MVYSCNGDILEQAVPTPIPKVSGVYVGNKYDSYDDS